MMNNTAFNNLDCEIYPLGTLSGYKYAVICTFYNDKLILSQHKDRSTWEMQGGHIEVGETPLECAVRELFEESGIKDADLHPVCDYKSLNSAEPVCGVLFLASAKSIGKLPESEMQKVAHFDGLPNNTTYPLMLHKLLFEAKKLYDKLKL